MSVLDEHRLYLRDRHRVSAYDRALREVVSSGDVVVDLASGTGILGMLACRAGASRVHAIERGGIAGLARDIVRANGLDGIITGVRGKSRTVTLEERANVVVCDQMGPFGLDAGILDVARDARARFLRPDGALVPNRIELCLAAIEHARMRRRVQFWREPHAGFEFSAATEIAANIPSYLKLRPEHVMSEPVSAVTIDLMSDVPLPVHLSAELQASRSGILDGVAAWFTAFLSPAATMTNSPVADNCIQRGQIFFPIQEPVHIEVVGQRVNVTMQILPADGMYSWEVEVPPAKRFRHTTLRALMLERADLDRTNPHHRPLRSLSADAAFTVLQLSDGRHTLREIEDAVFSAHRELFATESEASAFVARVLARE